MPWPVSVIVPVYNAGTFLKDCLESLRNQTLRRIEVIIIDDASTDNSAEIARNYMKNYPAQFRYIQLKRTMGTGTARNIGLRLARGEYIGFVDADDVVEFDMFSHMYTLAHTNDSDMVICGMRIIYKEKREEILPEYTFIPECLFHKSNIFSPVWNKLYKKDFIITKKIFFPPSKMAEDVVFMFKIMANQPELIITKKCLYMYKKNNSSVTLDISKREEVFISIQDLKKYLVENEKYKRYKNYYIKICFLHLIYYPLCLLIIDSLFKGRNRWLNIKHAPSYFYNLLIFLRKI